MTTNASHRDVAEEARLRREIADRKDSIERLQRCRDIPDYATRERALKGIRYHEYEIAECERLIDALTKPASSRINRKPRSNNAP